MTPATGIEQNIPARYCTAAMLKDELEALFPAYNIAIKIQTGSYVVTLPRILTEGEIKSITTRIENHDRKQSDTVVLTPPQPPPLTGHPHSNADSGFSRADPGPTAAADSAGDHLYNLVIGCLNLFEDVIAFHTPYAQPEAYVAGEDSATPFLTKRETSSTRSIKNDGPGVDSQPEHGGVEVSIIRRQERSFDLWIKYTGALAMPGSSLDDRLQDYDEIKEMVAELLHMILRNLQLLLPTLRPQDSERPRMFEGHIPGAEALDGVDGALDRLHLIAAAIRRNSCQSHTYSLDPGTARADDAVFEGFATLLVKKRFPSARSTLHHQLAASIAARRKRIQNLMRHGVKLSTPRVPSTGGAQKHPRPPTSKKAVSSKQLTRSNVNRGLSVEQAMSQTTLTTFNPEVVRRRLMRGPTLSAVSTGSEVRDTGTEYPNPPLFGEDDELIACHFCLAPLSTAKLKQSKRYWEAHVDGDLQPYVCLSEDCATPFLFFSQMKAWLEHMEVTHSIEWTRSIHMATWYCDSGHSLEQFGDIQSFQRHMRDLGEHPQQSQPPTDVQLATLSRRKCQLALRDDYVCPLCDCVPENIRPITHGAGAKEVRLLLEKHVAAHIKSLAMLSLPAHDDKASSINSVSKVDDESAPKDESQGARRILPSGLDSDMEKMSISFTDLGPEQQDVQREQQTSAEAADCPIKLTEDDHWDFYWERQPQASVLPEVPDFDLKERLWGALVNTRREKRFLPNSRLPLIIHEVTVFKELRGCAVLKDLSDEQLRDHTRSICFEPPARGSREGYYAGPKSFRKIFGILILIDRVETIVEFLHEDVGDSDLPLIEVGPRKSELRRKMAKDKPLACFKGWRNFDVRLFEEWQWSFKVPFFAKGEAREGKFYVFEDRTILPFVEEESFEEYGGAWGDTKRIQIHPDHHDFHDPRGLDVSFAIKRLHKRNTQLVESEVQILKRFSGNTHPNIVSLLATIQHRNEYFLLFYWADMDLSRYWMDENPKPEMNRDLIVWMSVQCEGLADGLFMIQDYELSASGHPVGPPYPRKTEYHPSKLERRPLSSHEGSRCYGDIRPENILWYRDPKNPKDRGVLRISYFHLAEFDTHYSRIKEPQLQTYRSSTYRPPETELEDGAINRRSDIWPLGCLYLEFITWALGGYNFVRRFAEERLSKHPLPGFSTDNFFEIDLESSPTAASVKPAVTNWIDYLHTHPRCTEYVHDFLNLIKLDMLVVEMKAAESSYKLRVDCAYVRAKLRDMRRICGETDDYGTLPASWRERV